MSINSISLEELQNLEANTVITFFKDTNLGWFAYYTGELSKCDDSILPLLTPLRDDYDLETAIETGARYYYTASGGGGELFSTEYPGGCSDPNLGTVGHYGGKPGK